MTKLFDLCVVFLRWAAGKLGISYEAINVWIFCIIWPLLSIAIGIYAFKMHQEVQILRTLLGN